MMQIVSTPKKFLDPNVLMSFPKTFMTKLGNHACDMIRDETTVKGQDVYGHKFKPLSEKYAERKQKGKFKRQSEKSSRANLVLTGDMMQDLQPRRVTKKKVVIGWTATESGKVIGNAVRKKKKRIITAADRPVSKTVMASYMGRMNRQVQKNIAKATGKKMKLQMGKK